MTPKAHHSSLIPLSFVLAIGGVCVLTQPGTVRGEPPALPLPPAFPTDAEATMNALCPTDIPDAAIVAAPTSDGAALLFLSPRHAVQMRRRVRVLSNMPPHGTVAPIDRSAPREGEIAASEPIASAQYVAGGAVLRLTARDPALIADVQAHPIEYAQRLAGDTCPLHPDTMPVLPADAKRAASPPTTEMPPGIIPGVGGISSGPMTNVPGLGF
jgi:hypothetical protein